MGVTKNPGEWRGIKAVEYIPQVLEISPAVADQWLESDVPLCDGWIFSPAM